MADYIEREKAQDGLDGIDWYHVNDKGQLLPGGKTDIETYVPFKAVEEMLTSIPAADVRPVVRGRWIDREEDYFGWNAWACSACGEEFVLTEGTTNKNDYKYCPNCGAMMEANDEKA